MGRPRLHLTLGRADEERLEELWKSTTDQRQRDRLLVIRLAMTGDHTLDDIAGIAGCGRMTVHRCLVRLAEGGWDLLLRRDKPGAQKSPMQAPQVQEEFQAKLRAGDFRTARQARRWLQERFGIELKVSSIYFWLNKYRASLKVPRPVHLKKSRWPPKSFRLSSKPSCGL